MTLLASAGGNPAPVTVQLAQAHEGTVRNMIHRFSEIGPAPALYRRHCASDP
ncbi:hypothetical protein ACFWXK_13875 [Streptomyces sp. NPDC059070]|uniref:hypothetical protein n=1 Tax=Streptomyces sp. NPDC059070 TaxID=3346713 RepID=UPI0036C7D75B